MLSMLMGSVAGKLMGGRYGMPGGTQGMQMGLQGGPVSDVPVPERVGNWLGTLPSPTNKLPPPTESSPEASSTSG